jgi:hypothetical protein
MRIERTVLNQASDDAPKKSEEKIVFKERQKAPHFGGNTFVSGAKNWGSPVSPTAQARADGLNSPQGDSQTPAARPARGRRMNGEKKDAAPANAPNQSTSSSTNDHGWGYIPRDPWGGQSVGAPSINGAEDVKSATSKNDQWGYIPRDPWGGQSVGAPSVKDDDAKSVTSQKGGWGYIPSDPWGGKSVGTPSVKDDDAKSVASSATGRSNAWGKSKKTTQNGNGVKKSWADQMEDDDSRSVTESEAVGW